MIITMYWTVHITPYTYDKLNMKTNFNIRDNKVETQSHQLMKDFKNVATHKTLRNAN